jgi:hypothetical protein
MTIEQKILNNALELENRLLSLSAGEQIYAPQIKVLDDLIKLMTYPITIIKSNPKE